MTANVHNISFVPPFKDALESLSPEIIKMMCDKFMDDLAKDLVSVQPMTKEVIGDPTRGYENIFTITYSDRKYEQRQYMNWENEGGLVI